MYYFQVLLYVQLKEKTCFCLRGTVSIFVCFCCSFFCFSKEQTYIGLYLNIDKCEFLVFNGDNCSESLYCDGFSIPRVKSFFWLGITVCDSMNALRSRAVKDISDKLRLGYSKIVANHGHYQTVRGNEL